MPKSPTAVLHLIDTLDAGGAERMAVNIANYLPEMLFESHFCTTRREGVLASELRPHVHRISLARQNRFDVKAILQLATYNQTHNIKLVHAHMNSMFIATLVSMLPPYPSVIWHDHYGNGVRTRKLFAYRLAKLRLNGIITANQELANWAVGKVHMCREKVWYVNNFATRLPESTTPIKLPGSKGKRIICVANIRPIKDQLNLIKAMELVVMTVPDAHLILLGGIGDSTYFQEVFNNIEKSNLKNHISYLGQQREVAPFLYNCDIGVISSVAEGLPLALLEYGAARLATVSTSVGQCPEVLDYGALGILVPTKSPNVLAAALIELLQSPEKRQSFSGKFYKRVHNVYSTEAAIQRICEIYDRVLGLRLKNSSPYE